MACISRQARVASISEFVVATGQGVEWLAPVFTEIVNPTATLAISAAEAVALSKESSAEPASNRTAIVEFQVEDRKRAVKSY